MNNISQQEAIDFVTPFIGKPVNRVWRGHGSAIFLEVGELNRKTQSVLAVGQMMKISLTS